MLQEDLGELMRKLDGGDKEGAYENNDDGAALRRNPNYYQTLVEKFEDMKIPLNNTVSKELANSFTLADSQMMSSKHVQANNLSDFEGLMRLITCTNVNLY